LYYLILNDGLTSLILVWALTVIGVGRRPSSPWYGSAFGQFPMVLVVLAKSSKVSAKWVVGLVISAKSLKSSPSSLGLDQVDSTLDRQVGLGLAHTGTVCLLCIQLLFSFFVCSHSSSWINYFLILRKKRVDKYFIYL